MKKITGMFDNVKNNKTANQSYYYATTGIVMQA
jgi:hypothetical protein